VLDPICCSARETLVVRAATEAMHPHFGTPLIGAIQSVDPTATGSARMLHQPLPPVERANLG
jgi:hypothetical protein